LLFVILKINYWGLGNVKKLTDINGIPRLFDVFHEAQTRGQKLAMDLL
jgi:hypothetical protein